MSDNKSKKGTKETTPRTNQVSDNVLKRAAFTMANGGEDEPTAKARALLLGESLPLVKKAAKRARLQYDPRAQQDACAYDSQVVEEFLQRKFGNPSFNTYLAGHANPRAAIFRVSYNLAVDVGRWKVPETKLPPAHRDGGDNQGCPLDRLPNGDNVAPDDQLEGNERLNHMRQLLQSQPLEDQLLLEVVHAEHNLPSRESIALLAHTRGITVERLIEELRRRQERITERRKEVDHRATQRRFRQFRKLHLTGRRLHKVQDQLRLLEANDADEPELKQKLEGEFKHQLVQREVCAERLGKLHHASTPVVPGGVGWLEVATILGLLDQTSTLAEERTTVNSLTVRYRRLKRRLRAQLYG
jgi:hypothetical protein